MSKKDNNQQAEEQQEKDNVVDDAAKNIGAEADQMADANTSDDAADAQDDPIAALEKEVADLKERLMRSMAETENVRRRAERDKEDAGQYAIANFARDVLNIADNLDRTMQAASDEIKADENFKTFIEGVDMTNREILSTMERHGIKRVEPAPGDKFDHNLHQAMFKAPNPEFEKNTIMQVVSAGYVIKDRLLRPAMVGVSEGGDKPAVDETV